MEAFGEAEVIDLVRAVWASLLGWDVDPADAAVAGRWSARVAISGGWSGIVVLRCDEALLRRATAALFGLPPEEATAELMADALGELTNIVGGNLKALLPGPCALGLPTLEGSDAGELALRVELVCESLPLAVEVRRAA